MVNKFLFQSLKDNVKVMSKILDIFNTLPKFLTLHRWVFNNLLFKET